MKNNFIFCLCILLLSACANKSSAPLPEYREASYLIPLDEAIEDNEFSFKKLNGNFRYIQLETTSESLLADIRFIGLLNDTIVVVDEARQIMSFTNTGKYIGKISNEGDGLIEYRGIQSFSFDKKSGHAIFVDFRPRVFRYDLKGNLIASYNPRNKVVRASVDNSLFSNDYIFNYHRASNSNSYAHSYYGINDGMKSEFINPNLMYNCAISIWSEYPLTQLDDTIAFVKPLSDTIFQFTNGNISPRFVFQHKQPLLPQEKIDLFNNSEERQAYHSYLSEQQNDYFVGIKDIFETKDFLLFSLNTVTNYVFDKPNRLLYKVTGFKDESIDLIFTNKKNSDNNSFIAGITSINVLLRQYELRKAMDKKGGKKLMNSLSEYERLILDFEETNNPIVIIATFGE